jgi:hypothetical protein
MKKSINFKKLKTIQLMVLTGLFLFSLGLFAGNIEIKPNGTTSLTVVESNYIKLQLSNSLAEIRTFEVNTEKGVFTKLTATGYVKSLNLGGPELPVKRELIELPQDATPVINIISYNVKEYQLSDFNITNRIFPVQPPRPKTDEPVEFIYDKKAYLHNNFSPTEIVTIDVLGQMRGVRIGRVNIAPVQYNPVTNTIRVYEDIEFEINFENANISQTIELKKNYYSPFFTAIHSQLINYQHFSSRDNFMRYPVKYVIVSDPMFETQLQAFVEWKTKKGFTVIEAYTDDPNVGNTTTSIKAYLQDLYNAGTPEDPAPSFILFVGDVAQVPAWSGSTGGHATDLFYCEYTSDYFPEVYYGRFSAETTAHLQPQIDKTLQYEQYLMPDPSFLNEVVMVAGMDGTHGYDWGNGQINYGTINYFNVDHGITSHTYLYPESGSHSADIIQNVSDGVSFGNYTAHCSPSGWGNPSFVISDVAGLQNTDKYGLLIGNCCASNEFNGYCFGEALLRAENKGALGYIGGSNSTMWDPDYYWGVGVGAITQNPPPYEETTLGAYDRLFHDHGEVFSEWYVTQDEIIYAGNLAVTEGVPSSAEYYWEIYCVMGDPSVMIYLSEPPVLTVSYDPLMPLGSTSFTITTEPYAYVGISKDGVLHGAALADSLGIAVVPLTPITIPGDADVIVTKQNAQPYIGTVVVASPQGPYLILNSFEINDELGNNNGLVDFGEDITLDIELENIGNSDAVNVTTTLSTEDTLVTITDDFQEWGNIAAHDSATQEDAFAFTVDELIPDQHVVWFDMLIEDETKETWNSSFTIILNAPSLIVGNLVIDDSNSGNDNGRLDPGETADLIISTSNMGHCDALNTTANLFSSSGDITINNSTFELDTLACEQTKNAIFNVTIGDDVLVGTVIIIEYTATSGVYTAEKTFVPTVGIILEDFETGTFENFGWTFAGNADWVICATNPYEGEYCAQSGDIDDEQTSVLYTIVNVMTDDSISFYKKVSCEDDPWNNDYDYLVFFIDDVEMGRWDGEVAWSREAYPVTAGEREFKWVYSKDYSVGSGEDCAWIDYIIFPPVDEYVSVKEISDQKTNFNIYPNPMNNSANIILRLDKNASVNIEIYNSIGQKVIDIVSNSNMKSGIHSFMIDAASLQKGLYFCVLNSDNKITTKKLIILK